MSERNVHLLVERAALLLAVAILGYLVLRTYVLSQWTNDWSYIRGPLAPRDYYQLGHLDEPIPSKEYLPYTRPQPPVPFAPAGDGAINQRKPTETTQDRATTAENGTGVQR